MLDLKIINSNLKTNSIGKAILQFDEIDSTNNYLKNLKLNEAIDGLVVQSEFQTNGHGRFNRVWNSNKGENLLFSVLLKNNFSQSITLIPLLTSLAVANAIDIIANTNTECKWPNDVILNNKKICGILIENCKIDFDEFIIIGIGVNVNQIIFPDEIENKATSILKEIGKIVSRENLLSEILNFLELYLIKLQKSEAVNLIDEWKNKSTMFNKIISVNLFDQVLNGKAIEINQNGSLVFETLDGKRETLISGEVTLHSYYQR